VDLLRYARHVDGVEAGIAAAKRFVSLGGHLDEALAMAEDVNAPKETMRTITTLNATLRTAMPKARAAAAGRRFT
jgi:hypothetical protein